MGRRIDEGCIDNFTISLGEMESSDEKTNVDDLFVDQSSLQ